MSTTRRPRMTPLISGPWLRNLCNLTRDAILCVDDQQRIIFSNPAAEVVFGYRADEFLGQPLDMLIPEGLVEAHRQHLLEFAAAPEQSQLMGQQGGIKGRRKDGAEFPAEASITKLPGRGRPAYGIILRDITGSMAAERGLARAHQLRQAIVDSAPVAIIGYAEDGTVLSWNTEAERMFGWTAQEVMGKESPTVPPERLEERRRLRQPSVPPETVIKYETQRLRKDGALIDVRILGTQMRDAAGNLLGNIGFMTDISSEKRTLTALQETHDRLQSLVDASPLAIITLDLDHTVLTWNPAAERIYGWRADEILDKPYPPVPEDDREVHEARRARVLGGETVPPRRLRRPHKDGALVEVRTVTAPLRDLQGEVSGILIFAEDISAEVQTEQALQESAEFTRALVDGSPLAIVALDREGTVKSWSTAAERMFGWTAAEVVGHPYPVVPDELAPEFAGIFDRVQAGEEVIGFEATRRRKDGSSIEISASIAPLHDAEGRMTNSVAILADISQRKQAERELQVQLGRLAALHTIDLAISSSLDSQITFNVLLDQTVTQLQADAAAILLLNPLTLMLEYTEGRGFRTQVAKTASLRLGEGYAGQAALERRPVQSHLAQSDPLFKRQELLRAEGFASYNAVPLIAKGQVKGVLEVFHRRPFVPNPAWLDYLQSLGAQAAIAIDNLALYDDLQRSNLEITLAYDATLEGWVRTMDMRDKETEGHSLRVSDLAVRLARTMGVSGNALVHLRRGALLHDIGKMAVPDQILHKPGPLTEEEWVVMRRHPQYAYDFLANISYLRPALEIPYCHHERWDGAGYPRGLAGDTIPLAARIFAIADIWDALRSDPLLSPRLDRGAGTGAPALPGREPPGPSGGGGLPGPGHGQPLAPTVNMRGLVEPALLPPWADATRARYRFKSVYVLTLAVQSVQVHSGLCGVPSHAGPAYRVSDSTICDTLMQVCSFVSLKGISI